ncbi:MAG: pyridoxal-phosphate dependent enzyme [bacterium]|nr:pyridoxal-phosphate dependent enzyme [bacterium]
MSSKIVRRIDPEVRARTIERCRKHNILIPTFQQLRHPETISPAIVAKLKKVGLWDVHPLNLFRISWKNDIVSGGYGAVNAIELPSELTGVRAKIIGLVGKYFPTGAHKVGAAFGCLVPRLVSGEFDPDNQKAVWPSTGNYCRGGAFDCALLDCTAIAILPEEMSKERFDWLREIGAEVIATPGCESNVKEIYDKCAELRTDSHNVIFNQFEEFGNPIFHYNITGPALEEALMSRYPKNRVAAFISATGSAGTIAAGDYLKSIYRDTKIVATEALQCPTIYRNGFGAHRIEGIGDKHIPWVHNVRNTDAVAAIDDADCMALLRLFNEPAGREELLQVGIPETTINNLPLLGISSICNLLAAIKTAKYFEYDENDTIVTVFTDSAEMYQSRLQELTASDGAYQSRNAIADYVAALQRQRIDAFRELNYYDRKAVHNLKYYTWVEQQGKSVEELNAQWNPEYWKELFEEEIVEFDRMIEEFNYDTRLTYER